MQIRLYILASIISIYLCIYTLPLLTFPERKILQDLIKGRTVIPYQDHIKKVEILFSQSEQSNICTTPTIKCILPNYGPIGSVCWCIGPSGPVKGVIEAN